MIKWLEKLGVPDLEAANTSFQRFKKFRLNDDTQQDLEAIRENHWSWVDANDGIRITSEKVAKMRIILCLVYEDNRELEDTGYFEGLLISLGTSPKEAYDRT